MKQSYLNIVGLAFRAGKCTLGEEAIVRDIKKQKISLLIIANDASNNTKKKLTDKCTYYKIPYVITDDRDTLSNAIGKSGRVAIGITDKGFAQKISTMLN
ncbi:L7Ae/L30e/S12e/Gadd45 family ribosomal protein [Salirhabdus salicampi]|uniref:L7Ae/L30e/S12e/Gadd45 family ribosomal protein n=1 Tax=Salirhabdus salicampi TaxID=476102 RepID=UPI0020C23377|nr:ribosomal L7Ae/L30e/S12e/Gadd45 family protein [Salirhabdus salicampi]MCP8616483.1 ribosomal L7Ae/L30e/S12e/Gadd45 family protein [Salirhabdus salicampi]